MLFKWRSWCWQITSYKGPISEAAVKYYNTRTGDDFHQIKVVLLGPTGKAAYNIKGNTVHSAFAIPANQSLKNYKQLDSSRLNTLRSQFGGVKLIFVDEISMVGNSMFAIQLNNRLKDMKGFRKDFGGVSIIAICDLFQLEPVMDRLSTQFRFSTCILYKLLID